MELTPKTVFETAKEVTSFVMNRLVYLGGWAGHSDLKAPPANIQIFESEEEAR